ncbi:MAG: DeoR/GlpR transcriptional regulator [Rhizobiaceae bacterium]|nr:DeoR/GlpR transcriptional regulator [Rhizobiaceae bacterium]
MAPRNKDRLDQLAALLNEKGVLHLKDAARRLGVSEMTVRRDIAGEVGRFAYLGGHIMPAEKVEPEQPYELALQADRHAAAKREACRFALGHIHADDTIFVDCGTTLQHLIDLVPQTMPLTVVCYALNIAERLAAAPNMRLILLGGLYHPETASFSGPQGLDTLDRVGINTAFLSAAGLDPERGATCAHFHEVAIKQKAIATAQKNLLVIDTSKLGRVKPAFFAEADAFDVVYTENGVWLSEEAA